EAYLVAERQQLLLDRADQRVVISARKVGTSDRSLEQDITDMGELCVPVVVDHVPRRMAGTMQNLEIMPGERDNLTFVEVAVRGAVPHAGNAIVGCGQLDIVQKNAVRLMRAHYVDAQLFLELHCAACMVDMPMRYPDRFDLDSVFLDRCHDLIDITTRINDHTLLRLVIKQDGTVLLERGDRNDARAKLAHLHLLFSPDLEQVERKGEATFGAVHFRLSSQTKSPAEAGDGKTDLRPAYSAACACFG